MSRNRFTAACIAFFISVAGNTLVVAAEDQKPAGQTLEDFYSSAIASNPTLNIARERWNVTSARRSATNSNLLPQVNANANVSDNDRTSLGQKISYTGERYSLQLSQVLFNWQAFAARGRAYLQEDQAEAEYYDQLSVLLTDIADKYLGVLQAEDALASISSQLDAMTNQVKQIQNLYDLQLAKITDLYSGQARLAAIEADKVNAESELNLSRETLRALTNLEVGALFRLPERITVTPLEGSLSDWIERTNANNLVIESHTYALQAADKHVAESRGAYMPRVSMVVQQQKTNIGYDNVPIGDKADSTYVGIDVSMPLFAGGRNRANVREAVSLRNIAENELRKARLEMVENTRLAYFQVKAGESRIAAARKLAESTASAYAAMQRGFELGTVTSVDVLNALRDQYQAERELQKARYDHIRANLMLRRESGMLTPSDLTEISNMLVHP